MAKNTARFRPRQTLSFPNGTRVRTPFRGTATQWENDSGEFRSARLPAQEDSIPELRIALAESGFVEQETIHLDLDEASVPKTAAGMRGAKTDDAIVVEAGKSPVKGVQVVLYADESGGMSWHLPEGLEVGAPEKEEEESYRAGQKAVFTIPARTGAARASQESGPTEMRGWVTAIGRKVLKVLVIPLAAKALGNPTEKIVQVVERKHSQNLIRPLDVTNYQKKVTTPFQDWKSLSGKRALLIVHGIISSTDGMLHHLPSPAMKALQDSYQGRVVGYDHFTLSIDPDENARFFLKKVLKAIPKGTVEFDVLCHSRGGIVSRAMVERGRQLVPNHNCVFKKVFFVATPNAGSVLGNPEHIVDMVDVFTNFLTKLPDGTAAYVIEAVLAMIKLVAYTLETALPGLAAMGTSDKAYINTRLNRGGGPTGGVKYGAAAADYDPDPKQPRAFFSAALNAVVDRTFKVGSKAVANDLVVPRDGVHDANGSPMFPIADPLIYDKSDHVYHNDFFAQPRTIEHLKEFLASADVNGKTIPGETSLLLDIGGGGTNGGSNGRSNGGSNGRSNGGSEDGHRLASAEEEMLGGNGGTHDDEYEEDDEGFRGIASSEPVSGRRADYVEESAEPSLPAETRKTPLPAVELKRKPEMEFPNQIKEGETLSLVVKLTLPRSSEATEDQISFALGTGQESVDVIVLVTATGFTIKPAKASMTVRREREEKLETATFLLTAKRTKEPVKRVLHADFFVGNSIVGSVTHYTYVVPKTFQGKKSPDKDKHEQFAVPVRERQECEWIIAFAGSSPTYQVSLISDIPGHRFKFKPMGTAKLPTKDLTEYIDSFVTKRFSEYPKRIGQSKEEFGAEVAKWKNKFTDTIEALGRTFWQWLPDALREEYFSLHHEGLLPRSISIYSDDMVFPWELVIPNQGKTVLKRLGVAHVLGRWQPGLLTKPPEQLLKVQKLRVLNPNYSEPNTLKWAAIEATKLKERFPGIALAVSPADLDGVNKLFDELDVQVLHFSGHGDIDSTNADLNKILLENGDEFEAINLAGKALCTTAQPVVYMNACSVGNVGETVARAGGFASNFVTNGCSGVIAPLWPINDRRSMEFALSLYEKLALGRSVGEALQELREENEKDPTYHAYTYFGDPWVRLILPPPAAQ